jgi:hypothetical protein
MTLGMRSCRSAVLIQRRFKGNQTRRTWDWEGGKSDDRSGSLLESIGSNLGSIDSGLLFHLILSRCRVRVPDGTKEFVLFLSKVDFDEVLFIPIPEEIVEFLDKV